MARNKEARDWGAALLREVVERAAAKGKTNGVMTRMAYVGAGAMNNVANMAAGMGFRLVIQPPEERGSGRWYAMGGSWRELLKAMVFHFCNREDEELIANGLESKLENVVRPSNLSKELHEAGLSVESFTYWLQRNKVPTIESFCLLALFEGFGIEWREVPHD